MKKLLGLLLTLGVIAGAVLLVSQVQLGNTFIDGELGRVERRDIVLHVNASGTVEPASRTEIKSKASGQVAEVPVKLGQIVNKGDLLIRLDPQDEERNVARRQNEVDRAKVTLEQARIRLQKTKTDVPLAKELATFRISDAQAALDRAEAEFQRLDLLRKNNPNAVTPLDHLTGRTTRDRAEAALQQAKVALQQAEADELAIPTQEQEVALAEAALRLVEIGLREAQQRLSETEIRAPGDGQVVKINTAVGEQVASGQASLTGGTVLMVIADTSQLYIDSNVDEADIGKVLDIAGDARPARAGVARAGVELASAEDAGLDLARRAEGNEVAITVESRPEDTFLGVIDRISPEPTTSAGVTTYRVRIRLVSENQDKLMLGMQGTVKFTTETKGNVLAVPFEAIADDEARVLRGVYIPKTGTDTQPAEQFVPLRIGITDGLYYEILDDGKSTDGKFTLSVGDQVFTRRPIKLDNDEE